LKYFIRAVESSAAESTFTVSTNDNSESEIIFLVSTGLNLSLNFPSIFSFTLFVSSRETIKLIGLSLVEIPVKLSFDLVVGD